MPGRIFQNIILQFKDTVDTEVGVIDAEGTVIACTELSEIGQKWPEVVEPINEAEDNCVVVGDKTFKALPGWSGHFAVFTRQDTPAAGTVCSVAAVALSTAKNYYEAKHDKVSFIKNIISDNILLSDLNRPLHPTSLAEYPVAAAGILQKKTASFPEQTCMATAYGLHSGRHFEKAFSRAAYRHLRTAAGHAQSGQLLSTRSETHKHCPIVVFSAIHHILPSPSIKYRLSVGLSNTLLTS